MNGWRAIGDNGQGFFIVCNGKEIKLENKVSGNIIPYPASFSKEKEILLRAMKVNKGDRKD